MQERFQKEPTGLDDKDAAILAYAYLRASVPFTLPFFENDEEFHFTDGRGQKTRVSSFGLRRKDESKYRDLRDQVEVLYLHRDKDREPTDRVCSRSLPRLKPNQVILACIPRKGTIQATLRDLEQKIAEDRPEEYERRLGSNSTLLVPNLNWNISHHFAELEGANKRLLNPKVQRTPYRYGTSDHRLPT